MERNNDYPGKEWQPIFDYMVDTFDVSLTLKEMEELVRGVSTVIGYTALQARCDSYEKSLKEIGARNCDYQTVNDGKLHDIECRACKANEALNGGEEKEVDLYCMVCGIKFTGPEPRMCCSGKDCGCMGLPIEPIVCSKECYDNLRSKRNQKDDKQ